jgi:hypothetical protein
MFERIPMNYKNFNGKSYQPIECDIVLDGLKCGKTCSGTFDEVNRRCAYAIKKENRKDYI